MNRERDKIIGRCCNSLLCGTAVVGLLGAIIIFLFVHGSGFAITDVYNEANCTRLNHTSNHQEQITFDFNVRTQERVFNTTVSYDQDDQAINRILSWNPPFHHCWVFHHKKCNGKEIDELYFEYPMRKYTLTIIWLTMIGLYWLLVIGVSIVQCGHIKTGPPDPETGEQMGFFRRYSRRVNHRRRQRAQRYLDEEPPEIIKQQYAISPKDSSDSTSSSEEDPNNECIICLRKLFKEGKAITQPSECCGVIFHEKCLMAWFENHDTCVMCQKQVISI